ncbi:MAG TPA: 50S ribosomal protein L13 [Chloroflexi bacterium]|jgi:large subunit ribosomal protein L13|nr:50S ribosomal protein L13 [Chloroflexota bacterium]
MKTYVPKQGDIEAKWYLVDATGQNLGRLASDIARVLRGKHKAQYTPNDDVGDFVVVTNADKFRVSGKKLTDKTYFRHSGYPGGLRETSLEDLLVKHPERALEKAVRGMLPHSKLGAEQYRKLKVYAGAEHPHAAQQPRDLGDAFPGGQPTGADYEGNGR